MERKGLRIPSIESCSLQWDRYLHISKEGFLLNYPSIEFPQISQTPGATDIILHGQINEIREEHRIVQLFICGWVKNLGIKSLQDESCLCPVQ